MTLVSFRNVEKRYVPHSGVPYVAVREFNLETLPAEFFCLLGPSGCGKTTVLNMLAGFEQPSCGSIEINGIPITRPGRDRAVVFQGDDSLFSWLTAIENVEFGLRMRGVPRAERRERARHFLHLVGLKGQENKHPHQMSGGMKQRIQIARVLANEPTMLLMDEPFAALDAQTRLLMQEEMRRIASAAQTSVFFITHDIDEAIMLGTRIGVMKSGPASALKDIVEVELGEDRNRADDGFLKVYRKLYHMIREEVSRESARDESGAM
jgi:NitT/TauT family transport system ATP-binding protein